MNDIYNKEDIQIVMNLLHINKAKRDNDNYYYIHINYIKYLLGQTIRCITIPEEKFYLSYEAKKLWDKIRINTNDNIFKYYYNNTVKYNNEIPIEVKTYKGASSKPIERILKKGDCFHFREVFHDDHIIPMKLIVKRLFDLEKPDYDKVMSILKNISICRMLKIEDRRIKERSKRPFNESEIVEKLYSRYGIYLIDYKYSLIDLDFIYKFDESIHLRIPKLIVKRFIPHPEENGYKSVELFNEMIIDVYKDEEGTLFSITNDDELIKYVVIQQELIG